MNLYFDVDAGYFVTGPGTRERVDALSFKRGDTCSIAVRFVSGIVVQELGAGAAGKIGMKEQGEYDADFVASDSAWTKTGTGPSTVYTFELNLNTSELNTLLADDGTEGNDVASVELMFEMEYTVGGVTTSSNTITATVHNDVVKGDETGPTLAGGTVPPVNEVAATATYSEVAPGMGDADTITIGSITYRCKSTLAAINDFKEGATLQDTLDNLVAAINAGAGAGTLYFTGTTANPDVTAVRSGDDMIVTAKPGTGAGDDIPTTGGNGTWSGASLEGGTPATEGYLGTMKVDSDYLYVVASVTSGVPTWKKIALSAL